MFQRSAAFVFFASFALQALATGFSLARAEDPVEVLPDDEFDEQIRSPEAFFGFPIGDRHLRHHQVVEYLQYLSDNSPRAEIREYARSHGQRPLVSLILTSETNQEQLDSIRVRRKRLTSGKSQGSFDDEPVVMYMGYSVHGDESSGINAAPLVAYYLAASKSKTVEEWLNQGIFLIDPALNPDGIDRFANWANENRGQFPSASSLDREHVQPWPGGRTNYYWFDLNRDWLPLVHPESQGRLKLFHQWKPNVVLDFHEMSGNSSFFFQPGILERTNPLTPDMNVELTRAFAVEHARRMDSAGELFYTQERFDDFYVGKGSTYPDLHGCIGILFEQGSTRGLKLKNERSDRHFRDTVANQLRMSLSSLSSAYQHREKLLEFQRKFYNDSLQEGEQSQVTGYALSGTASRIRAAAKLLRQHSIRIYQPETDENLIQVQGEQINASEMLVVPAAQPEWTFVRSLMEPLQDFEENIFYDVSAWHVPSAFDLQAMELNSDIPQQWLKPWTSSNKSQGLEADEFESAIGFAFLPVELAAPQLVAALQQAGVTLRVTTQPMHAAGKEWPQGTFLVTTQDNPKHKSKLATLAMRAANLGIQATALTTGMTAEGPDVGSDTTLVVAKCNPLLVVGEGTSAYTAGALWHYLDHRLRVPSTLVEASRLKNIDLRKFSCVILPSGRFSGWAEAEVDALEHFVEGGGTVIAVSSAIQWLQSQGLAAGSSKSSGNAEDILARNLTFGNARNHRALQSVAGIFFETKVDLTHPLAYGLPDEFVPTFRDHSTRYSMPSNPYEVAAKYTKVIAGYCSQRNRKRLQNSCAVWAEDSGNGRFILLADNPVFRGYIRASERFLSNAILLGPSLNIPTAPFANEAGGDVDGHGHAH